MKRIISMLIENKPGALARVVGLFHQRGYNIESLNVGPVFDGTYSRMTVTTRGSENEVEQITKQINKIIDVIKKKILKLSSCLLQAPPQMLRQQLKQLAKLIY
jgi:acetolactate synthase I/III small subunit